jgi:hypothetical protein
MTFEDPIVFDAPAGALFYPSEEHNLQLIWDPFLRSAELLDGATEPAVGGVHSVATFA